jgi:hypothetical protein
MMKRIFVLLVVALLGASVLVPQAKADVAKAEVDTAWVMVGMPRMLHLEITVAPGSQVQWPASLRQDGFLAYDYEDRNKQYKLEFGPDTQFKIDSVSTGNTVTYSQDLQFFAFDSAGMVIPPFKFVVNGKDTVATQMLALKCDHPFEPIPEDVQATQDLKPVMIPPFVLWDYIWWFFWLQVATTITVISILVYLHYRKHRKEKVVADQPVAPKKLLPAHVTALQALQALAEKKLWQAGQSKLFYTELTDILRRYIEERYKVSAMECTTDQILEELLELTMSQKSSYSNLKEVLQLADLVKFAKYEPLPDENQMAFMNSRLFVEQTKETVVEEPQNTEEQ